ncbi:hypothetical protein AL052_00595 [Pseudomonas amygdali pv. eriobotryae]|nr:hypothetical protein AL052_00595 [Pseudomonas amygdali pv. eriobotryae]
MVVQASGVWCQAEAKKPASPGLLWGAIEHRARYDCFKTPLKSKGAVTAAIGSTRPKVPQRIVE